MSSEFPIEITLVFGAVVMGVVSVMSGSPWLLNIALGITLVVVIAMLSKIGPRGFEGGS